MTFRQSATDADNHLDTSVVATYVQDQARALAHGPAGGGTALRPLRPHLPQQPQRRHARPRGQPALAARGHRREAGRRGLALRQLHGLPPAELGRPVLVAHHDHRAARAREVHELRARGQVGAARGARAERRRLPARPHEHALHRPQRPDANRPDGQPANERLRARGHRPPDLGLARRRRLQLPGRLRDERHGGRPRRRPGGPGTAPHVLAVEPLSGPLPPGRRRRHPVSDGHVRDDRQHASRCPATRASTSRSTTRSPGSSGSRPTWRTHSTRSTG